MKKRYWIAFLLLFSVLAVSYLGGCASVSTAPLPPTINIVPPSPDVPPEIAAFSGIWKGKWSSAWDTFLVVEKINAETAEVILSRGSLGICCKPFYIYKTARVTPGPAIEWINKEGDRFVFKMNKDLNSIDAFIEEKSTGSKWWRAHLTRINPE